MSIDFGKFKGRSTAFQWHPVAYRLYLFFFSFFFSSRLFQNWKCAHTRARPRRHFRSPRFLLQEVK